MAPRAGFEVGRKILSALFAKTLHRPDTPTNTPVMNALDSRLYATVEIGARRLPGFTSSICTSPMTRSAKPPSQ